jgi:hypothetical protein
MIVSFKTDEMSPSIGHLRTEQGYRRAKLFTTAAKIQISFLSGMNKFR